MELYILRHGIAEERSQSGSDSERALTSEGIQKTRAAGKALKKMEIAFDAVLSSPFVRAWQTAEIVVEELGCKKKLHACNALAAGAPLKDLLPELERLSANCASLLIVGHEPDLSALISVLLSGSPDLGITMKKGGLAKLTLQTLEPGTARLEWLLGPKHLCRLG
jgi:phosphohistidine phosphatase